MRTAALNDNKDFLAAAGDDNEDLIKLGNARLASDGEHSLTSNPVIQEEGPQMVLSDLHGHTM